ncbi:MAG: hypothetical protein AB8C46_11255 [Burkholderiaceae bacterium]
MKNLPSFEYQKFETRRDARSAFDTALESAVGSIRLYDRDGDFYGLERPAVAGHFKRLLRNNPNAQIRLVFQHVHHVQRDCPRLLSLMQLFGSRFSLRRLDPKLRGFERGILLIDQSLVMRRPHFDQMTTFWDVDEQEISNADRLLAELWDNSPEAVSPDVTGL